MDDSSLVFSKVDDTGKGLKKDYGLFGKSFANIGRDLRSGQGLGFSLFSGKSISQKDVDCIKNFVSQTKAGVPTGRAWANTMRDASAAGKQAAVSVKTGAKSLSELSASTAGATAATIGLQVATVALNAAISIGVAFLISAAIGAINNYVHAMDNAIEKSKNTKQEFESLTSEIENLESEIKELTSKINDLKAQGPLSLTDKAELSELEAQRRELEAQLTLKKKLSDVKERAADTDAENVLKKKGYSVSYDEVMPNGTTESIQRSADIIEYTRDQMSRLDRIEGYRDALVEKMSSPGAKADTAEWKRSEEQLQRYDNLISDLSSDIGENINIISENYDSLIDKNSELGQSCTRVIDDFLSQTDKATKAESQIETVLSLKTMDGVKEKLINAASFGGEDTLRSAIEDTNNLTGALEHSKVSVDELVTYIMNLAGSDLGNLAEQAKQLRDAFGNRKWETLQQFDDFLKGLDGEQLHTFYKYIQDNKLDISKWSMDDLKYNFEIAVGGADESARSLEQVKEEYVGLVEGIGKVKSVLSAQGAGKTLSINDLDSVKDYADALEYVGGAYQLNRDKVTELIKAKADEEKASNSAAKALKQQEYLKNAAEIEQLRQRIIDNNLGEYESVDAIQAVIDARLDENSTLEDSIAQYDVMNTALDQATGAYQRWLDAQSDTQHGSMFDQSLQAIDRIKNTIVNSDSADYGHIGDTRYQAALEFIIPDSIDADDEDAVKKYLSSLDKYMFTDDDGKFAGLDIEAYCQKAVERGLMVLEDGEFRVAGQTTMQEFAEGMGDSLDFTRSAIDYMELFGGQFSWADEEAQTLGDIGVAAAKAVEELRQIDGLGNVPIQIDVSEVENADEAVSVLDDTIASMNDVKAKFGVDSSEAEHANTVIRYCVEQKQQLTAPAIMDVDTSKVQGKLGEAIDLLQQFKTAQNNLDTQKALGLDTKEAQAEVDSLASKIKNNDVMMKIGVDTSSAESISGWIESHNSYEAICKLGVDESAIIGYQPQDKTATTHYDVDKAKVDAYQKQNVDKTAKVTYTPIHTAVDLYNPKNLERKVTYTITTRRTSGKNSTDTGTEGKPSVNGTAHVSGTAYASGTWGAKQGGKTLLGELGRRYCDRTRQRV